MVNIIRKFLLQIWYFLGAPRPASEAQKVEQYISMRESRDCLVAAVATLCGITYEKAHAACKHWNLPFFFESPLLSNPVNAIRALKKLGADPKQIGLTNLLQNSAEPGKVLLLIHDPQNPLFAQHWVVWFGIKNGKHLLAWGDGQPHHTATEAELIELVTAGWPNCILEGSI